MNTINNEQIIYFEDDEMVPFETKICYSKTNAMIGMGLGTFFIISGTYFTIATKATSDLVIFLFPLVTFLIGLFISYFSFQNYKKASKNVAQIILNEEGLQTMDSKFFTWDGITKEQVIWEESGDKIKRFLIYEHEGTAEKFFLDDKEIEIGISELTNLLKIYRGRFEVKRLKNAERNN